VSGSLWGCFDPAVRWSGTLLATVARAHARCALLSRLLRRSSPGHPSHFGPNGGTKVPNYRHALSLGRLPEEPTFLLRNLGVEDLLPLGGLAISPRTSAIERSLVDCVNLLNFTIGCVERQPAALPTSSTFWNVTLLRWLPFPTMYTQPAAICLTCLVAWATMPSVHPKVLLEADFRCPFCEFCGGLYVG
jgi:hypothetical protein